jgi:hypothetical protein
MKTCFKCNKEKQLNEFYKHHRMSDGHLNKCKECTKSDSQKTYFKIQSTPELAIKERKRQRLKEQKRRIEGKVKKYPRKASRSKASDAVWNAITSGSIIKKPCQICGNTQVHAHHEDYSKPLDVTWLCIRHHNDRHIHLRDMKTLGMEPLDIEQFIFKIKSLS